MDFDLNLTGFSADELMRLLDSGANEGLTDPDAVPEPPDEPITQLGDLWLLGKHRLLCCDSSKAEDVDRLLDGAVIHLVNTDPPYNVKVEPRSNNAQAAGLTSFEKTGAAVTQLRAKDRPLANDFVSDEEFDCLLHAWFSNLARVLLPGRSFYVWGGFSNCGNYPPVLKATGLYFSQAIIWDKQHPVLSDEKNIRGFSGVALLVIDEAARVADALYCAVRPMLAVSRGRLVALSTPFGKRGWYHDEWHGEGQWERVKITTEQCRRIAPAFLAEERRALGERWFRQEYLCSFEDTIDAMFAWADIEAAFNNDIEPLFPQ
jgi:hypothetical protein